MKQCIKSINLTNNIVIGSIKMTNGLGSPLFQPDYIPDSNKPEYTDQQHGLSRLMIIIPCVQRHAFSG